jgi:histidine triad (HIT) family protein
MECIFCQIVSGKMPSDIVYQDKEIVAFEDMHPVAPTHFLIIPRKHIPYLLSLSEADTALVGHMVNVANRLAKQEGVAQSGFRLVINCGRNAGQVVLHLHMHLLGGRRLTDGMG